MSRASNPADGFLLESKQIYDEFGIGVECAPIRRSAVTNADIRSFVKRVLQSEHSSDLDEKTANILQKYFPLITQRDEFKDLISLSSRRHFFKTLAALLNRAWFILKDESALIERVMSCGTSSYDIELLSTDFSNDDVCSLALFFDKRGLYIAASSKTMKLYAPGLKAAVLIGLVDVVKHLFCHGNKVYFQSPHLMELAVYSQNRHMVQFLMDNRMLALTKHIECAKKHGTPEIVAMLSSYKDMVTARSFYESRPFNPYRRDIKLFEVDYRCFPVEMFGTKSCSCCFIDESRPSCAEMESIKEKEEKGIPINATEAQNMLRVHGRGREISTPRVVKLLLESEIE